jgi:glucose uptake protein
LLAVLCGVLMGYFYRFVAAAMPTPEQFTNMPAGKLGPYTAMVFFALGILASNFVFNTIIMRRPISGQPVAIGDYFQGTSRDHLWGIVGGMIWAVGMMLSIVAAGKASFAVSYGLGQGATMVAALWGVFIWREFRSAPRGTTPLLALMFAGYAAGLALVIISRMG